MERAGLIAGLREFAGDALVERDGVFFLVDPGWGARERAQWAELAGRRPAGGVERGWLCVPTGGSSGAMKLARHDERTVGAAVEGFCAHFGTGRVDALGLLPPWHVSGLMGWARCAMTGGTHRPGEWRAVLAGGRPEARGGFVSLVPTQLARLLGDAGAEAWLRGFDAVLVGGGPAWAELRAAARAARVPVAFCYGMTETAALVAAQRPGEFLAGDDSCGRVLPHARVEEDGEGRLAVAGASLFFGYWPEGRARETWRTDDLGEVDGEGRVWVRGRADGLIISGGEKVNPAEVEAVLRAAGGAALADVAVAGVAHAEWGSEVVAVLCGDEGVEGALREGAARGLAAAKRPKRYVWVGAAEWPRDARGKLSRVAISGLAGRGA